MKAIAILAAFFLAAALAAMAEPGGTMRVAVPEFEVKGDLGLKDGGAVIADWMSSALAATGKFDILERSRLDAILSEQSLALSGMIDEETSARIGELSGAQAIVTGSLVKWSETLTLTARLIDLSKGSVLSTASYRSAEVGKLSAKMDAVAKVLAGQLPRESLERDSLPAGKPGSATSAAISVVRATPKGEGLRLVLDRGALDGMAKSQSFAIMMPVYEISEVSGTRVQTGMRRVGALTVGYVEPDYAAGDLLPEMGEEADRAALVREAIALPLPLARLSYEFGVMDAGFFYGMGMPGPGGVLGLFSSYELAVPALFLEPGGLTFGLSYEYLAFGNYLARSRSGPGVELFYRMVNWEDESLHASALLNGGGAALYWQLKKGRFQARAGVRASYCAGSYIDLVVGEGVVTVPVEESSVEPFVTATFVLSGADWHL